jgi:hypothetical protein
MKTTSELYSIKEYILFMEEEQQEQQPKKWKKASKAVINQRLEFIIKLMRQGKRRSEIVDICSREYGITFRMVDKYLAKINELSLTDFNDEYIKNDIMIRYNDLYEQAMRLKDVKLAASILKNIGDLIEKRKTQPTNLERINIVINGLNQPQDKKQIIEIPIVNRMELPANKKEDNE